MMLKRLTHYGNSAALIIDKAIMALLHITIKTPLEITTDGKNLIVSPVSGAHRARQFQRVLAEVNRRHGKTLKSLAK